MRSSATRVLLTDDPFPMDRSPIYLHRGHWPCHWIGFPGASARPFVAAFRLRFRIAEAMAPRIHVTADERYQLFLDSELIGCGSERGDLRNWYYETYDLALSPGEHVLVARVWALGELAPDAQISLRPGFLCAAAGPHLVLLGTGHAPWTAKVLSGYKFETVHSGAFGVQPKMTADGNAFDWAGVAGGGEEWQDAEPLTSGLNGFVRTQVNEHLLKPAPLPPMLDQPVSGMRVRHACDPGSGATETLPIREQRNLPDECDAWQRMLGPARTLRVDDAGGADQTPVPISIPPNCRRRVIVDLDQYFCAYSELTVSGGRGARVRVRWAESLFETAEDGSFRKGNRDRIEGKFLRGACDEYLPDGGGKRRFEPLWWRAGRYVELLVETAETPLTVERFSLRETRYPLEMEARFACDKSELGRVAAISLRGLQMCAHETYMDCPYYEQLMYAGDTRLEALVTYAITRDDRLPRKAIQMFDASRLVEGLSRARYPSRTTQIIPPFCLWWVGMVYDYALWRGDRPFVRTVLPGVRHVLDAYARFLNDGGLVDGSKGEGHWWFMDWVPQWAAPDHRGIPPGAEFGVNGTVNWQYALVLRLAAELETFVGEPELAERNRKRAARAARRSAAVFWDENRRLFADDPEKHHFSEHAQCMALLSGALDANIADAVAERLFTNSELDRTTISFAHYLFETCAAFGRADVFLDRLDFWFGCLERGVRTTVEREHPSRSDCHGWGAHPIYHFLATILGIRPARMGFESVRIEPHLGPLRHACGRVPHPQGDIDVDLRCSEAGEVHGTVRLPESLQGTFAAGGRTLRLNGGEQRIEAP